MLGDLWFGRGLARRRRRGGFETAVGDLLHLCGAHGRVARLIKPGEDPPRQNKTSLPSGHPLLAVPQQKNQSTQFVPERSSGTLFQIRYENMWLEMSAITHSGNMISGISLEEVFTIPQKAFLDHSDNTFSGIVVLQNIFGHHDLGKGLSI